MTVKYEMNDAFDLETSVELLSILARELGHDMVLLRSGCEPCKTKYCCAVLAYYENYDLAPLKVDGRDVEVRFVDSEGSLRSNTSMYGEVVRAVHNALKNGGTVSGKKRRLHTLDVPEFMVKCSLDVV